MSYEADGGRELEGRGDGKGNGGFKIMYGKGQERWPDGHQNEWKIATDRGWGDGGHLKDMSETWNRGDT